MNDPRSDDLFDNSKMSFGQHLDELRAALIKIVTALAIGLVIGLVFANQVVQYIQTPLLIGLADFRLTQAKTSFDKYIAEQRAAGQPVPEDLDAAFKRYLDEGLLPRVWRIDRRDLARQLEKLGAPVDAELLQAPTEDEANANDNDNPPDEPTDQASELLPLVLFEPAEDDPRSRAIGTHVIEGFMVWIKAALLVSVVVSSPATFYFLWSFVAAGLYPHERKYVYTFLPFSLGLFLLGAAVAFFFALKYVLQTLFGFYGWLGFDPLPSIGEWLNFALILPVGFGVGFQLPLVMLFLERIGIFTAKQYQDSWRIGVLVIAIASMVLTPSDWQSMVLLGVPMTFLYFGGILLCKWWPRRQTPFGEPV